MLKPKESVRRFDVFAEYSRQDAERDGKPPAEAKGYGIWLAKVVASKRYGRSSAPKPIQATAALRNLDTAGAPHNGKWRTLNGVPQTDKLFDKEVVQRMGSEFYERVVVPAVKAALDAGESYTSIRDRIRQDWKPG